MKFYKRLNVYKASNVQFNPTTLIGTSYEWYQLARSFDGVMVLNTYNYSSSTCKHISKMRALLTTLGYREIVEIEAPQGLQNLGAAVLQYNARILSLYEDINKPRSHKAKNTERLALIAEHEATLKIIEVLRGAVRKVA